MSDDNPFQRGLAETFLGEARRWLGECRGRIEHCLGQLTDAQVWWRPHDQMNSVGNLVLHLCGNLRQWVVSGVGGAADVRDRPKEFAERGPIPKEQLLQKFLAVTAEADAVLAEAGESRLLERRRIQGSDCTVLSAVFDSITHFTGHTQEIVYATRLQVGDAYRFAWTPTTPEQIAAGKGGPEETVEARDAVFETGSISAMLPPDANDQTPPPAPPVEAVSPDSPLRDPLLELEQEFQDQQDEGKV